MPGEYRSVFLLLDTVQSTRLVSQIREGITSSCCCCSTGQEARCISRLLITQGVDGHASKKHLDTCITVAIAVVFWIVQIWLFEGEFEIIID